MKFPIKPVAEGEIVPLSEHVCLVRTGGILKGFSRQCPHEGADLAMGYVEDGKVRCAWHNLPFDPSSGEQPCRTIKNLETFTVRELGNEIELLRDH